MAKQTKKNKIDKRTKEYKTLVAKGLGDTIEQITEATGIKALTEKLFDDCGCSKRKEWLNNLFPYDIECLEEQEYIYLDKFFQRENKFVIEAEEQKELLNIYNRVFHSRLTFTTCGSCVRNMVRKLEKMYHEYKQNL
jgi:hypothetical protein